MYAAAAAAAKSLQSCPTLCDPIDGSPPGSPVPGILQARTPEWVAISFSNAWKWKVKVKSLSRVRLSATPWTAAHQAPPSMGFSRQEYWSGVPLPSLRESIEKGKKPDFWSQNILALELSFLCICALSPLGFPGGSDGKESACNTEDWDSIPGLGISPGEGNGYRLQYFCLRNPMDTGVWQATVHGVTKSLTQLSD